MNILHVLFKTSIGKKVAMAVTGFILFGFVISHLSGNLQIFAHPDKINGYAHLLESLGPALWVIRLFLIVTVVVHIWVAVQLTFENRAARPNGYQKQITLRATLASRYMRWSGFVVLAFIVYHILHFTVRVTHGPGAYPMTVLADGTVVRDVHSMMVLGFQNPLLATFYLISVGLLSWHLRHGLVSMFQSIGLRTRPWSRFLERVSVIFCVLYLLGNALIVVAAMTGQIRIQNPLVAGYTCRDACDVCGAINTEAIVENVDVAKDNQS
jgi:succinate dehydrogenase / fumarate reductase cytochrome b subunit